METKTAGQQTVSSEELEAIYKQRFGEQIAYRKRVWSVVVSQFFSRFIARDAKVLDLGCGYGEFINNVDCGEKYGMDLNSRAKQYLNKEVIFLEQDCSAEWPLAANLLDLVFTSNFFEHLISKQALSQTLMQANRCLAQGGRLIAMGPNVRFVGGAYWDFWDHHLPLTEISLAEILRLHGFEIEEKIPRFLPYTMVNKRKFASVIVASYLKMPVLWRIFGKQFLIVARKR